MIRKLNRAVKNWLRPKRIALGRIIWDRKVDHERVYGIDLKGINSILFMRYDGKIGDMVVNTLMFREIKKRCPHIRIGVVTRGAARDIIENNPYVDEIYRFEKGSSRGVEERYDLLIDFSETLRVNEMKFINLCGAKVNMGLDKGDWKLFDLSVEPGKDFGWDEHITKRYQAYLKKLGIQDPDLSYEIFIPEEIRERAERFFSQIPEEKRAVLNPYGASSHRTLNEESLKYIVELARERKMALIMIAAPDKKEEIERFIAKNKYENIYFDRESKSILESASFIERADLVITPDTSIVHIASALNKDLIALYRQDKGAVERINEKVWAPTGNRWRMLLCQEDINNFDKEELKRVLDEKSINL